MCAQHWDDSPDSGSSGPPARRTPAGRWAIKAILFYQYRLSPLKMGSTCRFEPTCSAYALQAIKSRGFVVGTVMAAARIAKCGPWHPGGFDPPPGWSDL
ncbi:membrane protein insertion efficiency factor YidD [Corynebacterium mendelii]|nr:membrane protein insertion efficiency factor YidD [Corynebacterium mendelii]